MKKIIFYISITFIASLTLNACQAKPSICDCVNNAKKNGLPEFDLDLQKKCEDFANQLNEDEKLKRFEDAVDCL